MKTVPNSGEGYSPRKLQKKEGKDIEPPPNDKYLLYGLLLLLYNDSSVNCKFCRETEDGGEWEGQCQD